MGQERPGWPPPCPSEHMGSVFLHGSVTLSCHCFLRLGSILEVRAGGALVWESFGPRLSHPHQVCVPLCLASRGSGSTHTHTRPGQHEQPGPEGHS